MSDSTKGPAYEFYSVRQAAKLLGVTESAIRLRIFRGQLESVKLGGGRVIPAHVINKLLDR